jgi:hypothetical protein
MHRMLESKTHDGVGVLVPELLVGGFLVFSCEGPWWGRSWIVSTCDTWKEEDIPWDRTAMMIPKAARMDREVPMMTFMVLFGGL